jgi:adenine-specific DNA glycosylase
MVCCEAEPMCVLCPLRQENAMRSLAELKASGLKGRFAEAGLG